MLNTSPTPWTSNTFLVTAANGREVTHTGLLGRRRSSHQAASEAFRSNLPANSLDTLVDVKNGAA